MKKAIPALILSVIALPMGLMGYEGYIFGIPALILGILAVRTAGAPRIIGAISLFFACMAIVGATSILIVEEALKPPVGPPVVPHLMPHLVNGTAGTEVIVKNWGVTVTPPTYTEILYKRTAFGNEYLVYEPMSGYHFALVKITAINHGKEEDRPDFYDIKLVTTEGLRYKQKSASFNHSYMEFAKPPTPLLKKFSTYDSVLPREKAEGYFYFQIPENAVPESLFFKHEYMRRFNSIAATEARIKLGR